MKISEGMEIISNGWVRKPKEFRVRFQQMTNGIIETRYSPPLEGKGMKSDVTTWRYAWKLFMATKNAQEGAESEEMTNITVVDEKDRQIPYYETGQLKIYNSKQT